MTDYKELKNMRKDIILNFSEEELERYVLSLAYKYYEFILKKDCQGLNYVMDSLKTIVSFYEDVYSDISDFVDYCLLKASNDIFIKVFDLNCNLWSPNDKSISREGAISLTFSIERSRRRIINERQSVREVYEAVINDENVSEDVIEKITELYNSYKLFDVGEGCENDDK